MVLRRCPGSPYQGNVALGVVMSYWSDDYYPLDSTYDFMYDAPGPCIVCGAEFGACPGSSQWDGILFEEQQADDPSFTFTVQERVFETVESGGRPVRRLKYTPGAKIHPSEAKRLGLIDDSANEN